MFSELPIQGCSLFSESAVCSQHAVQTRWGAAMAANTSVGHMQHPSTSVGDRTAAEEAARRETQAMELLSKKVRKPAPPPPINEELEWVNLAVADEDDRKEESHEELRAIDLKRKHLLTLARNTSASSTLFKIWQLPRTVLPRLAKKPVVWLVLLCFAAGAVLSRFEYLSDTMRTEIDELGLPDGATVTFIVVFYVGYCYSRSNQQFDDVQVRREE